MCRRGRRRPAGWVPSTAAAADALPGAGFPDGAEESCWDQLPVRDLKRCEFKKSSERWATDHVCCASAGPQGDPRLWSMSAAPHGSGAAGRRDTGCFSPFPRLRESLPRHLHLSCVSSLPGSAASPSGQTLMGSCEDEGSLGLAGPLPPSVALPSHVLSAPHQDLGIWNGDLLGVPPSLAPLRPASTPAALRRGGGQRCPNPGLVSSLRGLWPGSSGVSCLSFLLSCIYSSVCSSFNLENSAVAEY